MPRADLNRLFYNDSRKMTKAFGMVPESYAGVIIGNTKGLHCNKCGPALAIAA